MIETGADLSGDNTLALPARGERLARPATEAELVAALAARAPGEPLFVLGQGSNVVLTGDLPGLTLIPALNDPLEVLEDDGEQVLVRAGAGLVWDDLVAETLRRGWRGLENLSLIPGTVGAAPFQNIGAYGVELADTLAWVDAVSVANGRPTRFTVEQCEFDYRDSVFKSRRRGEFVITRVVLRLRRGGRCRVEYGGLAERFAGQAPETLDPIAVRDAVIALRRAKLPDPSELPNAGSFFKNPVVSRPYHQRLLADWPDLVAFPSQQGKNARGMKLAAGWLIERAGWKGRRLGPVGMHRDQALVLVNHGGARAADVLALADAVRADVAERFGVDLEQEPVLLP